MAEKRGFRVVIAGGGVAGLALANALERGGIDYILLERRGVLTPQVGASIGMLPNGMRILDQFGLYDTLMEQIEPIVLARDRDRSGRPFAPPSDFNELTGARTGYRVSFGERQVLLQVLLGGIKDQSKLLVNKQIVDIVHKPDSVTVKCADGTSYDGDILAGADGVRSQTRNALWRLAEAYNPELVRKDKEAMTAEYQCLFGICNQVKDMPIGDLDYTYDQDQSSLVIVSKDGKTFYFIFEKLDRIYHDHEIPHYTKQDAEAFARKHANHKIREHIPFSDLWENTISCNLVALEEAAFEVWTSGRIACLGDSIHKMTPNAGYGGNSAIESAAVLANSIKDLVDNMDNNNNRPSLANVETALQAYVHSRLDRAKTMIKVSREVTRLQAMASAKDRFFVKYCIPRLGDFGANMVAEMVIGSTALRFLPLPERSYRGTTMPFNPHQGDGQQEWKLKRAVWAIPFLVMFYLAKRFLLLDTLGPSVGQILESGKLPSSWGGEGVPVVTEFYGLKWLDDMLSPIVVFFTPSLMGVEAVSRHAWVFLLEYGVMLAIWMIESARRANILTPMQLPLLLTLPAQLFSIGLTSSLYFFLHFIYSPLENFKATDMRLTHLAYTRAVLPALLLSYYLPLFTSFFAPTIYQRISANYLWQLFPLLLSLSSAVLSRFYFPNTTPQDRLTHPTRDLSTIRTTVGITVLFSASAWLHLLSTLGFSPRAIWEEYLPTSVMTPPHNSEELLSLAGKILRFDSLFLWANTFLWIAYLFGDMRRAGMLSPSSLVKMLGLVGVGMVLVGPGATAGLAWLWREEILISKRHWGALTEETVKIRDARLHVGGKGVNGKAREANGKAREGNGKAREGNGKAH